MFTGLITDIGEVIEISSRENGKEAIISTSYNFEDVDIGASICCNGACMTVVEKEKSSKGCYFTIHISDESLLCTNLGKWEKGTNINLEKSLRLGDELGGHMVFGHVDDIGEVSSVEKTGDNLSIEISVENNLAKYIARKGSISVNGVSLTVNKVMDNRFQVNIIPHTLKHTTLSDLSNNKDVNIEIDMLARYAARMLGKD